MTKSKRLSRIARAIEAHVNGNDSDPFALLGPHLLADEDPSAHGLAIRACYPAAQQVEVLRRDTGAVAPMTRRHPYGFYEAVFDDATAVFDYRLRVTYPGGHHVEVDDPYRYGRVIGDFDLYLHGEGSLLRAYDHFGAHVKTIGEAQGVHFAVWAPNAERVSVIGDFNGWDGRVHAMRSLGGSGAWEILRARPRRGGEVQVRDPIAGERRAAAEGRSVRVWLRAAAAVGVRGAAARRLRVARPGLARPARGGRRLAARADGRVRGAPRLVGTRRRRRRPVPHLSRAGRPAGALREEAGLHPPGAAAGHGAPVLGVVGLSGDRLLRPDQPARRARGLQGTSWTSATATAWA